MRCAHELTGTDNHSLRSEDMEKADLPASGARHAPNQLK